MATAGIVCNLCGKIPIPKNVSETLLVVHREGGPAAAGGSCCAVALSLAKGGGMALHSRPGEAEPKREQAAAWGAEPCTEHAAVGEPGTDKPVSASSLNCVRSG